MKKYPVAAMAGLTLCAVILSGCGSGITEEISGAADRAASQEAAVKEADSDSGADHTEAAPASAKEQEAQASGVKAESTDGADAYDAFIRSYCRALIEFSADGSEYALDGLAPVYYGELGSVTGAGFSVYDLNGDGTDELLIYKVNDMEPEYINDIYTLSGGEIVHLAAGFARNPYYLLEDGTVVNIASSGASYTSYMWSRLPAGAAELELERGLSSYTGDFQYTEGLWYTWTKPARADEKTIRAHQAGEIMSAYSEDYFYPAFTLFSRIPDMDDSKAAAGENNDYENTIEDLRSYAASEACAAAVIYAGYAGYDGAARETWDGSIYSMLYPFLSDIPESRYIGEDSTVTRGPELYAVIPTSADARVKVERCEMTDGGRLRVTDILYEGDGQPFFLRCNVSEVYSDTLVTFFGPSGEMTLSWAPFLSGMDGHVTEAETGAILDLTEYED